MESTKCSQCDKPCRSKTNLMSHKIKCDELYDPETRKMKIKCRYCPEKFSKNGKKSRGRHEEKCPGEYVYFISLHYFNVNILFSFYCQYSISFPYCSKIINVTPQRQLANTLFNTNTVYSSANIIHVTESVLKYLIRDTYNTVISLMLFS